jgi:hypothetical protein
LTSPLEGTTFLPNRSFKTLEKQVWKCLWGGITEADFAAGARLDNEIDRQQALGYLILITHHFSS